MAMLRAFDAVARLGGFRRAAQALEMDHSAISRHVRSLEDWLGRSLVVRSGRSMELTDLGRSYHSEIAPALRAIASATTQALACNDRTQLSIWCVHGLATQWLAPRLGKFREAHPEIEILLRPTDQFSDLSSGRPHIEIRFNARPSELSANGMAAIKLSSPAQFPVASPDFLARIPKIHRPSDLLKLTLLHEASPRDWQDWLRVNDVTSSHELAGPRFWYAHLTLQAAVQGQGVALATQLIAHDELSAGRLEILEGSEVPFFHHPQGPYHFLCLQTLWHAPHVAKFRSWLIQCLMDEGLVSECGETES